jgi:hypothetical protein
MHLLADLAAAVAAGKVSKEILQRYLALSQGLLAPFMRMECASGPALLQPPGHTHRDRRLPISPLTSCDRCTKACLRPCCLCRGFRDRLLADPGFFVKVGIEVWGPPFLLPALCNPA